MRGKTDPAVVACFCLTLSFCRVEGKGRVGQLECSKRCCVVQGLQEVTLLWNSVGLWRVGASGASTSG